MNDSKKDPPPKKLQYAKLIDEYKEAMSECQKRIDELPIRDNPEGQRLKKQIATINIKMSAALEGRNPNKALKKKELQSKIEKDLIRKPKNYIL